jgi:phage protein U
MRFRNLVAAVVAATSVLALAAAGASAAPHPSPSGLCNVNISASPHLLEAGEAASVYGRLRCQTRARGAGQVVRLLQRTAGSSVFKVVETTTTDAHGFYELTTPAVDANSVFYVRSHRAASANRTVKAFAHVTISGPADGTALLTGVPNHVTFSGTVSPADAGALVVLQRQNALTGNDWHMIDSGTVGPEGSYTITHAFIVPGDANIRVVVRSERRLTASPSEDLSYEISQAQNPLLTIDASLNPLEEGQATALSGVLAGATPGTPVTLMEHTIRQVGFAPVSEVMTGSGGVFTFPPLSPVDSTFYQLRSGAKYSAVLYEGVRDLLSAAPSKSTVAAGEPLTFAGAVTPEHSGHVIYLEQQDRSGTGFHVVQIAFVGPGSAYSIVHTIYNPGTDVLRVRIPGGPENEGATSKPFTITVTPASIDRLTPEAANNSTQPPEGEV